eukprot:TRINITY_DN13650_c0_g1_i2.p1 TRINITY_DN13650_c0_g1~~TRINITY_DN13650_c0_g1_i2.p1  ORF type:complete len:233 (+),score=43.59 TRINITY_DN13650_c0_g1_i2:198-896(+)
MAFGSGYADVLCLVRYYAFATMMTGNSIYASQSAARECWHDLYHYILLATSYNAGMFTFRMIDALMRHCCPDCSLGPATVLAPFMIVAGVATDLTFYAGDDEGDPQFHCGKFVPSGVYGFVILAHAMGIVNGISMNVDKVTTNAVTGHMLTSSSLIFDQVHCLILGTRLPDDKKSRLVLSVTMVASMLTGVAVATLIEKALGDSRGVEIHNCLLYTSPSPRDRTRYRMPSSA